jgi:hypothetical protein
MSDDRAPQQLDGLPAEKDLVRDFVDSIVHGIPSEISNSDAFEATRATLMARLSCQLGRTVTRGETL